MLLLLFDSTEASLSETTGQTPWKSVLLVAFFMKTIFLWYLILCTEVPLLYLPNSLRLPTIPQYPPLFDSFSRTFPSPDLPRSGCSLTLWWTCGTWVPHNFRAFHCRPPTSVHCKKYLQLLPWFSAVSRKKQNVSITNTTDFRVTWSWKTRLFPC